MTIILKCANGDVHIVEVGWEGREPIAVELELEGRERKFNRRRVTFDGTPVYVEQVEPLAN